MKKTWALMSCFALLMLAVAAGGLWAAEERSAEAGIDPKSEGAAKLVETKLGETRNVHAFGTNLLCGQPSPQEFAMAKQRGIQRVITLRTKGEVDWDQQAVLSDLGLEFYELGFRAPDTLTDELLDRARKLLAESDKKPVMLHCGSANRVGAVWAAYRAVNDGLSVDAAIQEAKEVGLRNADYEKKVVDYIRRRQAEQPKEAAR